MMSQFYTRAQYDETAKYVRERTHHQPRVGLVLGSGLNPLADAVQDADLLPYDQIPHFPIPSVEGHTGRLVLGRLSGVPVMVMQGRVHFYEGYSIQQVVFPIRVMQIMGVEMLIVTNAAGGLNPAFHAGELMLIKDHISFLGMAGANPLMGPNDPSLGPRFPDMSHAYDPELRQIARQVAEQANIPVQEGVYVGLSGPSFETPAELRFLRLVGADAVGMSTVPEVTVARHGGLRVLGISGISNVAALEPGAGQETTHKEVLLAGQQIVPRLTALVRGVLEVLGSR